MWSAGDGDDNRRFLADLRALRDTAALEFDELAARAHYPSDVLKEAESGPSLPTLPILAAYVRACDGDVPEWEERWRRLGFEAHADPGLPVRAAGASPAAVAGARAGGGVAPPESYDAERIRAVLRSAHGSSDRGARGTASRKTAPAASAGAGWDTDTSADTVGGWGPDTGAGLDTGSPRDAGALWAQIRAGPDSRRTRARTGMAPRLTCRTSARAGVTPGLTGRTRARAGIAPGLTWAALRPTGTIT